jgi:hypothetical protein
MENYTKQYLETLNDMEKIDNDLNTILDNLAKEFFNLGQSNPNMTYEEAFEENGTAVLGVANNIKDMFNIK